MTNEEIVALIQNGQNELLEELIQQNAGLVWTIAKAYLWQRDTAIEMDDLRQAATVGLLESVSTFDSSAEMSFASWACSYMKKYIRALLGIRSKKIRFENAVKISSLDAPTGDEGDSSIAELLPDPNATDPQERAELLDLQRIVGAAVDGLPDVPRQVVKGVYMDSIPLAQLAADIGIPYSAVTRARDKGEKLLRRDKRLRSLAAEYHAATYRHVGVTQFNTTWTSSVEAAAERRARIAEQVQRIIQLRGECNVAYNNQQDTPHYYCKLKYNAFTPTV